MLALVLFLILVALLFGLGFAVNVLFKTYSLIIEH